MVLKRKRNLKIDTSASYSVFLLRDLDQSEVEDYVEARDTGMEADEEKEVHLQNVMKGTGKDIPIPVIREIDNVSRGYFQKKNLAKKVIWENDCENSYIETSEDLATEKEIVYKMTDATLKDPVIQALGITEPSLWNGTLSENTGTLGPQFENTRNIRGFIELISKVGNDKNILLNKNEELANFCLKKTLIRYEKPGFEAYTCFRDRIFTPTFKSRRNEALMYEKINRMGVEFSTMKSLCELYEERCYKEYFVYKRTLKIAKNIFESKMSKKKRSQLIKMMLNTQEKGKAANTGISVHELMTDRMKIASMRNLKSPTELYLDIRYYSEAMKLVKNGCEAARKLADRKDKET